LLSAAIGADKSESKQGEIKSALAHFAQLVRHVPFVAASQSLDIEQVFGGARRNGDRDEIAFNARRARAG
jgi:hypothetical protein